MVTENKSRNSYSPSTNYEVGDLTMSKQTTKIRATESAISHSAKTTVPLVQTTTVLPDRNMKPAERRISMESWDPCIITTVK
ncbi:hypothetical protein [Acinetobacter bereziniae]|uniref:hypothetical protein n=1 Tax=Acinetobacter bereziniae TaxID=106648 RepID=UPI00124FFB43|nr:hypothetical protein [Acinetobacter bereziniae]